MYDWRAEVTLVTPNRPPSPTIPCQPQPHLDCLDHCSSQKWFVALRPCAIKGPVFSSCLGWWTGQQCPQMAIFALYLAEIPYMFWSINSTIPEILSYFLNVSVISHEFGNEEDIIHVHKWVSWTRSIQSSISTTLGEAGWEGMVYCAQADCFNDHSVALYVCPSISADIISLDFYDTELHRKCCNYYLYSVKL